MGVLLPIQTSQEDICSLRCGVDRFAFSVLWRMNAETAETIGEPSFFKSAIHSRAALTYGQAQALLDRRDGKGEGKGGGGGAGPDIPAEFSDPAITEGLAILRAVTRVLRSKRMSLGALTLASPEVKFEIDQGTSNPLDVGMYVTKETNKIVEEMMLLANETVATRIFDKGFARSAVLRRHPVPTRSMFEPLLRACRAVGIPMEVGTSKDLAESLDRVGAAAVSGGGGGCASDAALNTLVRFMATRCMTQAEYFSSGEIAPSQFHHYGLAMPIYTHFTSPIRRYADVLVHRMLAATIGLDAPDASLCESDLVAAQCEVLNCKHRNAQLAGRASGELYTLIYFRERPTDAGARVVRVKGNGVVVFVPKFGIEGPIKLEGWTSDGTMAVDGVGGEEEAVAQIAAPDGSRTLRLFDDVRVRIEVHEEGQSRQEHLVLSLLP